MARDTRVVRGVYERDKGSNVWWIYWTDANGKRHREKAGLKSYAVTLLAKRKLEAMQGRKTPELQPRTAVLFGTLLDDALEHSKATNGRDTTAELERKFERMRLQFGSTPADKITKQDITRWLTEQGKARNWTVATLNRHQAAFSLVFRVALDNEKVASNPASRIRRKAEDNGRTRYLSPEEEDKLANALKTKYFTCLPAFLISIHTGLRASEQWNLKWADVDLQKKILTVRKQKSGKGERHIPLNSVALAALQSLQRKGQSPKDAVFLNSEGTPMRNHREWFDPAVEKSGIGIHEPYTWHCNRHTFASRLVMADVNLTTVARLMGHTTIQMTMRYSHLAPAHNASAVERLAVQFGGQKSVQTATRTATRNWAESRLL